MSEHDELVKGLAEVLIGTYGYHKDAGRYVSMSADQWGRINDERSKAAQAIERLEGEKRPSDAIDLGPTEEVLNALAKRIEDEPNMIGPMYVQVNSDRMEATLLRGIVNTAKVNYDAFMSCLPRLKEQSEQLADARAEIERKDRVFERIAEANVLDMDTLHPDGIQQEARQAQREAFERACKAQCKKCRTTGLSTYDSRLREWGHHGYDFVRCDAVFIRALMDEESTGKEPSE